MRLVAVGCSWGGLAALTTLLQGLPAGLDAAVVIAQHRSEEESALEAILRERSPLPLDEVEDKDAIEPGHVYLAPPGYHLLVQPGRLALSTEEPVHHRAAVARRAASSRPPMPTATAASASC